MGMTQSVGTLVILGASGDLSSRLLLPAIGQLLTHHPERRFHLVGSGAEDWSDAHWRSVVKASFKTVKAGGPAVDDLLKRIDRVADDLTLRTSTACPSFRVSHMTIAGR